MGTTTTCRRLQLPAASRPPSPSLTRSRSGTSSISLPDISTTEAATTTRGFLSRPQSTTRSSRTVNNSNSSIPKTQEITAARKSVSKSQETINRDALARILQQRGSPRNCSSSRGVKSSTSSPSAWALSPGRSSSSASMCMTPPESPVSAARARGGAGGGGVRGVLKYFKQKKVSPVQEEDFHRFRVLYNRLLQWRFVNARAGVASANLKANAEEQLSWVCLRIYRTRKYVVEKLCQMQKLQQEIKLHQIISLQMPLLNEWAKMDARNYEALSRVTRKLHALSVRVPLVQGAKADVMSMCETMNTAMEVMDCIEEIIAKFLPQAENILYLMTELTSLFEQLLECFEEVDQSLALLPTPMARETSLRVHLIQTADNRNLVDV